MVRNNSLTSDGNVKHIEGWLKLCLQLCKWCKKVITTVWQTSPLAQVHHWQI